MKQNEMYTRTAREKGKSNSDIKQALIKSGWDEAAIENLLRRLSDDPPPAPPPPASRPLAQASHAWDAFEHIVLFISMGVFAIATMLVLHQLIDTYSPNFSAELYDSYAYNQANTLRGYLAAIIVSLPLFCLVFLDVTRRTKISPAIRNLLARKILIYLTLVIAFITMLSYVITTVYSLLSGDVTLNYALHFLVTFIVVGTIFAYYFGQVKEDRKIHA